MLVIKSFMIDPKSFGASALLAVVALDNANFIGNKYEAMTAATADKKVAPKYKTMTVLK